MTGGGLRGPSAVALSPSSPAPWFPVFDIFPGASDTKHPTYKISSSFGGIFRWESREVSHAACGGAVPHACSWAGRALTRQEWGQRRGTHVDQDPQKPRHSRKPCAVWTGCHCTQVQDPEHRAVLIGRRGDCMARCHHRQLGDGQWVLAVIFLTLKSHELPKKPAISMRLHNIFSSPLSLATPSLTSL